MGKLLSTGVKIFKEKSPDSLQQAINDHVKVFDRNPAPTTIKIEYAIAEETVIDNNENPKKELIYSTLVHVAVTE